MCRCEFSMFEVFGRNHDRTGDLRTDSPALWPTNNIGHSHPYINQTHTTYAMLTRASTTSLTCAQSTKPLFDARADSKALDRVRTCRLDCRTLRWITRELPGEKNQFQVKGISLRVEILLKTDDGYPKAKMVNAAWQPLGIPSGIRPPVFLSSIQFFSWEVYYGVTKFFDQVPSITFFLPPWRLCHDRLAFSGTVP